MKTKYVYFSSEAVSAGHPDKICDQISDAILDAFLEKDPNTRAGIECLITDGKLLIAGEVRSNESVDVIEIAKNALREIGYISEDIGFDVENAEYEKRIQQQSLEIAAGVDTGGAGDQGIMFGYASKESPECMPLAIYLSQQIIRFYDEARHEFPWLRPDAKTQVTVKYPISESDASENWLKDKAVVSDVLMSAQHDEGIPQDVIRDTLINEVIKPALEAWFTNEVKFIINPSGSFVKGGPAADTGLTGRKIIVDTYGGSAPHGGGAFSGKDATKVDRSAAYMARYLAKIIVLSNLAKECTIQLAYGIGIAKPISIFINTHGTCNPKTSDFEIAEAIKNRFDLSPAGIIDFLSLRKPIYRKTAVYGHFGRPDFPWETINLNDFYFFEALG